MKLRFRKANGNDSARIVPISDLRIRKPQKRFLMNQNDFQDKPRLSLIKTVLALLFIKFKIF